jgi:hypothetical protein
MILMGAEMFRIGCTDFMLGLITGCILYYVCFREAGKTD